MIDCLNARTALRPGSDDLSPSSERVTRSWSVIRRFVVLFSAKSTIADAPSLSSACGHCLGCQKPGQPAQIDRQHREREHVAHFWQTTQLHLTDRRPMLLAIAEHRFDQLADDLADPIAFVASGARVDATFALGALAGLGVVF